MALDIGQSTLSKFERGEGLPKEEIIPKMAKYFEVNIEDKVRSYFGDKVIKQILPNKDADQILETAKEKLEYIKSKNYNQGKFNFNGT